MTLRQSVVVIMLLALTMTLAGSLAVFHARAGALAAEGRGLLSPDAVAVRVSAEELRRRAAEFAPGTRAFRDVDGAPRVRAVVLIRGSWSDVPPYTGLRFSASGADQALVGDAVHTTGSEPSEHVEVAGKRHRVVGRLGLRPTSLLAEDVVIADRHAFAEAGDVRTVLDGPGVAERAVSAFGAHRVEPVDAGANRRTNVDFVTPIILTLGVVTATLASVVAGGTAALSEIARARIRRVVGRAPAAVVTRVVTAALGSMVVASGIAAIVLAGLSAGPVEAARSTTVAAIGVQAGAFLIATTATTIVRRRTWS